MRNLINCIKMSSSFFRVFVVAHPVHRIGFDVEMNAPVFGLVADVRPYACSAQSPAGIFSPALMGTLSRFSNGVSGQDQRSL